MPSTTRARPLPRQRRALRNDDAILTAACDVVVRDGWGALTPGRVAAVAGLSRPTVLQRHPDRAALSVALWQGRLAQPWVDAVAPIMRFPGGPIDSDELAAMLAAFITPGPTLAAAVELLTVSSYTPSLRQAMQASLSGIEQAVAPVRGCTSSSLAARRAFLLSLAVGIVLEERRQGGLDLDIRGALTGLARAISDPSQPTPLPAAAATHLDDRPVFNTGDDTWDAVLGATLDCVGDLGFDAATVELIASTAGFTRTVIFRRYASKYALFKDASERMFAPAVLLNDAYQQRIAARRSTAIAEACFVRELMRPHRDRVRLITLEQVRLAAHDDELQQSIREALQNPQRSMSPADQAELVTEMAISVGVLLVAQLFPDTWALPYDVVFTPWRDTTGESPAGG